MAVVQDATGAVWATLLESSDDDYSDNKPPLTLRIHAQPVAGDALQSAFQGSSSFGILDLYILGIQC